MTLRRSRGARRHTAAVLLAGVIAVVVSGCALPVPLPFLPGGQPTQSAGEPSTQPAKTSAPPGTGPDITVPPIDIPTIVAPLPSPDDTPTLPPEPTKPPQPACPKGISVPSGVDRMVCGGAPANASHAPGNAGGLYSFTTPSRNIGCDWTSGLGSADGIECVILQATFNKPPKPKSCNLSWEPLQVGLGTKAYKGICRGDLMNALYLLQSGGKLASLGYGKALASANWACFSDESGLTCWNTKNHHGFKLARTVLDTW